MNSVHDLQAWFWNLRPGFKELEAFNVERARRYRLQSSKAGVKCYYISAVL